MSASLVLLLELALGFAQLAQPGTARIARDEVGCGVVSGGCETGSLLHVISDSSLNECQQACQANPNCNFYTYHSANNDCFEFTECHDFSAEYCPDECQSGSFDCVCFEPGECTGEMIGASYEDLDACMQRCYNNADCSWWSHYSSDNLCVQLLNCETIDETCTDCQHGEKACYEQGVQNIDVLFVTSGWNEEKSFDHSVEVIPLDAPQLACPGIPDIPYAEWFGHGFSHERQPVVCAMWTNRQCFKFNTGTWQWEDYVETNEVRYAAAGTFLDQDYILLGGGLSPNTTEAFSAASEAWSAGPAIPYETQYACATTFNLDQVMLSGGNRNNGSVYLNTAAVLDASSGVWSYLPEFTTPRVFHACGIATAADGSSSLVIAGGQNDEDGFLDSSEIFDLDSGATSWRGGADIPIGSVMNAYSLPYESSFLLVGGESEFGGPLSSIWQYDPDNSAMPWILREEELAVARQHGPVAILMKASDLNCTFAV